MALLGSGIDPRLFVQDFSPVAQTAQMQAAGLGALGEGISGAVGQIVDFKKQQADDKKTVDAISKAAEMFEKAAPGMMPGLGEAATRLQDQNIPLSQRVSEAAGLREVFSMGPKIWEMQQDKLRKDQELALRAAAMSAAGGGVPTPTSEDAFFGNPMDFQPPVKTTPTPTTAVANPGVIPFNAKYPRFVG